MIGIGMSWYQTSKKPSSQSWDRHVLANFLVAMFVSNQHPGNSVVMLADVPGFSTKKSMFCLEIPGISPVPHRF